jgi:hypothetical protein
MSCHLEGQLSRRNSNRRETGAYLPRSQVEAPGALNRNKIKAINDGLKLTFVLLLGIQNLLYFCHIKRKILSIAIT